MASEEEERTEQATPKKRRDARLRGEIARSPDVVSAFGAIGFVAFAAFSIHSAIGGAVDAFREVFSNALAIRGDEYDFAAATAGVLRGCLWKLTPLFIFLTVAVLSAEFIQSRLLFLPNKLRLDFTRLNPLRGSSRIVTLGSATQSFWTLVKYAILLLVVAAAIRRDFDSALGLTQGDAGEIVAFVSGVLLRVSYQICLVLVVFAVLDYAVRRWKYEQNLRMTQQELRDEMKEEGGAAKRGGRRRGSLDAATSVETTSPTRPVSSQRQARDPRDKEITKRSRD